MPPLDDDTPLDARVAAAILGAGSLGFGVLGLVAPGRLARVIGAGEDTARAVAFRDLGSALAFALAPTSAAALQRALYDLGDAVVFRSRRPVVAAGALAFATLAAWTAWRAR